MKSLYRIFCLLSMLLCLNALSTIAQNNVLNQDELLLKEKDMQWFTDAKFGMFMHCGLYSILAQGKWAVFDKRIATDKYAKLTEQFVAKKFNADAWATIAQEAGMKYMVMVSKHHDGFTLWESKASAHNFNSMYSAGIKDFVAAYVAATRKQGLAVGRYYSPLDWRFTGFFFPDMYWASAEEMKAQIYGQIRELMSYYGKMDLLWYDGGEDSWLGLGGLEFGRTSPSWHVRPKDKPYKGEFSWEPLKLNSIVRQLQPKIVINPRSGWRGDFDTPENTDRVMQTDRPWERCFTITEGGWGWKPDAVVWPLDSLIKKLVKVVYMDENLLLNVGPNAAGEIEPEQVTRLKQIVAWLDINGESRYGKRGGPVDNDSNWGGTTMKANFIYLLVMHWPKSENLEIAYIGKKIAPAGYLDNVLKDNYLQTRDKIIITTPNKLPDGVDTVIKLETK